MVDIHRYRIIYRVLYIPGGAGFLPSTVCHRGKVSAKLYQEEFYFDRCFWGEIGFMVLTTATTFVASSRRPHFGRYLQQGGSVHFHLRSCSSTPWKLHRTRQWDEMKRCPRVVSGEPVRPIRLCQRLEALHQFIWQLFLVFPRLFKIQEYDPHLCFIEVSSQHQWHDSCCSRAEGFLSSQGNPEISKGPSWTGVTCHQKWNIGLCEVWVANMEKDPKQIVHRFVEVHSALLKSVIS